MTTAIAVEKHEPRCAPFVPGERCPVLVFTPASSVFPWMPSPLALVITRL
jgi:hypothetical protein